MTAKIKLNAASGGGSFSLQAPSSSSNNRVMTLPDSADGTILTTTNPKSGSIIQVVETKITDVKSLATTNSWQDMPGFSVTITPSAANSKILVKAMINHSNRVNHIGGRLVRSVGGTVAIPTGWVGDASSSRTQSSLGNIYDLWYSGSDSNAALPFEMIDDSHNTTSAITYKLQFFCYQSGSYYVVLNRPWVDTDAAYSYRAVSSIIAMEVAA